MQKKLVVKLRKAKGNCFLSIPKEMSSEIRARYLSVTMDNGRLIYEPVEV